MLQSETVAALLLPTDFRAEPKIDCVLALVLLPTIRRGKAAPETKAPIISIDNEKRVLKSECTIVGIKMVAKAGTNRRSARSRSLGEERSGVGIPRNKLF